MRRTITLREKPTCTGLTLLEVLVSLAILGGALTAIGRLTSNGVTAAMRCELDTEAVIRCRSQLDVLLAESTPIRDVSWQAFADNPRWRWRAILSPAADRQLLLFTIAVERIDSKQVRFELTQLIRQSRSKAGA